MRLPTAGENLGIPLHRGAQVWYDQDKPGFLMVYVDQIALVVALLGLCLSGAWQQRLRIQRRQKDKADFYNAEILELIERVWLTDDLAEMADIRRRLFDIMGKVIEDMQQDAISSESFQMFAFPWEMAIDALRHRELTLHQLPVD
ncbi:hypothetical protein ACFL34_02705 [Candidatus Sumerlaeota bacterium]